MNSHPTEDIAVDLGLTNKRAIVTGASGGIGQEVVRLLRSEGAKVIAVSRSGSSLVKDLGALVVHADLASDQGIAHLAHQAEQRMGGVDILINCIGGFDPGQLHDPAGPEHWAEAFQLNVLTPLRVTEAVLPSLIHNRGALVHIAGLSAHRPGTSPMPYAVAKGALVTASRYLAARYGSHGIRSNTISPGPVATPVWEGVAKHNQVSLDELFQLLPGTLGMTTGHMITPAEVAGLAAFLVSPHASSITGADHVISAGLLT